MEKDLHTIRNKILKSRNPDSNPEYERKVLVVYFKSTPPLPNNRGNASTLQLERLAIMSPWTCQLHTTHLTSLFNLILRSCMQQAHPPVTSWSSPVANNTYTKLVRVITSTQPPGIVKSEQKDSLHLALKIRTCLGMKSKESHIPAYHWNISGYTSNKEKLPTLTKIAKDVEKQCCEVPNLYCRKWYNVTQIGTPGLPSTFSCPNPSHTKNSTYMISHPTYKNPNTTYKIKKP